MPKHLLAFFCLFKLWGFSIGQFGIEEAPFKIGFILEQSDLEAVELESALEILRSNLNVSFDFVLKTDQYRDSFTYLKQTCRALREGASMFITQASCGSLDVVQAASDALAIPNILVPRFSDCATIPDSSSTSFAMRTNNYFVYNRIGSILTRNDWRNYLIMYDDYFAQSYIQVLDRVLKESVIETRRGIVDGKVIKIYDTEGAQSMQDTLIQLNTDGIYMNFIVMASQQNTLRLLSQAERLGLFGLEYKWILANIDLDITQFADISPQFNALMILRHLPDVAFERNVSTKSINGFVDMTWSGLDDMGVSQNLSYLLNAAQLAIQALSMTSKSEKTNYAQVKNLNCLKKEIFKDGSKVIEQINKVTVLEDGNSDYFGLINSYLGMTVFQNSKRSDEFDFFSSMKGESRFEVFPHLDMLRYDVRKDGTQGWRKIDTFIAGGFPTTWHVPHNVQPFRVGKTSLDGSTLKIITVVEEPFIFRVKEPSGIIYYEGYCIDVLNAIQQQVAQKFNEHFDYDIEESDGYGVIDPETGKWNGMVAAILDGKADIAVAGMTRNFDREKVIDYTAAYMDYGVGILIKKPQPDINIYGFMEPLSKPLWCIIALSTLGTSITLYILAKTSPYERMHSPGVFTFANSVWWIMGAIMLQGGDYNPESLSNRFLCNTVWCFSVLLVSIYTANLAAFLTVTQLTTPIEELRDLAGQTQISYGTIAKTSLSTFFQQQAARDDLYYKLWDYMNKTIPSPMVRDLEEGYDRVLKSQYAFMWDYPVLQYQKKKNCDYMTVGKAFNRKKYAFAVPKGSGYLSTITLSILSLQELGVLEQIREKWFEGESQCVDAGSDGSSALTYNNIGGIFWMLFYGIILAIAVNIFESIWHKFIEKRSRCDFPRVMQSVKRHIEDNLEDSDESNV